MYLIINEDGSCFQTLELTDDILSAWNDGLVYLYRFNKNSQCFEEYLDESWHEVEMK